MCDHNPNREMYIMDWTNTNGDTSNDQHPLEETPGKIHPVGPVPVAKHTARTTGPREGGSQSNLRDWPMESPKVAIIYLSWTNPVWDDWVGSWQLG